MSALGAALRSTLGAVLDAGFVFWGLFVVYALMVAAYVAWMVWTERGEEGPP